MNYLFMGKGLLYLHYAYVELESGYLADSLFYRHKIPVKYRGEMVKDGEKYKVMLCKIKKKYQKEFEKALDEIPNKMSLFGHNDYEDFCNSLMKVLKHNHENENQPAITDG